MAQASETMAVLRLTCLAVLGCMLATTSSALAPAEATPQATGVFYPLADVSQCAPGPYFTVAHKILCMESAMGVLTPEMSGKLDAIIGRAAKRLDGIALDPQTPEGVERVLQQIDAAIAEENVIYPSWGLVETMSEGLTPVELDADGISAAVATFENVNRRKRIERQGPGVYYIADCDILSIMYLAVADHLKLPLRLVERLVLSDTDSGHNFVRWELSSGESVNWETMTGNRLPSSARGDVLSDAQLAGYIHAVLGDAWRRMWNPRRAIAAYRAAAAKGYEPPAILNELAWWLSTYPDPAVRDADAAMRYAARLCAGNTTPNYTDTCAAATARNGDFDQAVKLQKKAIEGTSARASKARMRERLALYMAKRPYTQHRLLEERAIAACDDHGDLLNVFPGRQCPDPRKYHYFRKE